MPSDVVRSNSPLARAPAEGNVPALPPDAAPAAATVASSSLRALLDPGGDVARAAAALTTLNAHLHGSQEASRRLGAAEVAAAAARADAARRVATLDAGIIAAKMSAVRVMEGRDCVGHELYGARKQLSALAGGEAGKGERRVVGQREGEGNAAEGGDGANGDPGATAEDEEKAKRCQVLATQEMEKLRALDEELVRIVEEHDGVRRRKDKAESALKEAYEDF